MTGTVTQAESLVEVADGVFGYVQLPGGWCVSNSGIITGPAGALVIDTLASESRGRALRDTVNRLAPGPGRTLVNTHCHGDHTFGNHLYGPGTTILAHTAARTEMAETGLALIGLWPQVNWGDVRVTLPTVTFEDRLTVHAGERRIELIFAGPAHTRHDIVAWLPAERVLFAGDIVLSAATPFTLFGSVSGTLAAIDQLRALDPLTVICGHGPVTGPGVFDVNTAYLEWIQRLTAAGRARGEDPLDTARRARLGDFGGLLDPERIVGNLHRAYAELADPADPPGTPLNVAQIFDEMVAYNGGHLPTCLA